MLQLDLLLAGHQIGRQECESCQGSRGSFPRSWEPPPTRGILLHYTGLGENSADFICGPNFTLLILKVVRVSGDGAYPVGELLGVLG